MSTLKTKLRLLHCMVASGAAVLRGLPQRNLTDGGAKLQRAQSFQHVGHVGTHVDKHAALQRSTNLRLVETFHGWC